MSVHCHCDLLLPVWRICLQSVEGAEWVVCFGEVGDLLGEDLEVEWGLLEGCEDVIDGLMFVLYWIHNHNGRWCGLDDRASGS